MSHVNGVDLYHELGGDGPDLLFLNGSGATLETSAPLIDRMRRHFRVLAFDAARSRAQRLRGSRRTRWPTSRPTHSHSSTTEGWQTCPVFGVSFGGMVAQEVAVTAPDRVERLALLCTSAGGAGGSSYPLHELADLPADERMAKSMTLVDSRFSPEWFADHPLDDAIIRARAASAAEPRSAERLNGERLQMQARADARRVQPHRSHHVPDARRLRALRRHRAGSEQRVDGGPHPRREARGVRRRPHVLHPRPGCVPPRRRVPGRGLRRETPRHAGHCPRRRIVGHDRRVAHHAAQPDAPLGPRRGRCGRGEPRPHQQELPAWVRSPRSAARRRPTSKKR